MTDETGSTLESRAERAISVTPGSGAALHLAFSGGALVDGERREVGGGGVLLGRGAPLFSRTPLDDLRMSRSHARIGRDGTAWVLEDLGSRNGTRLNGKQLSRREPLAWGDVIRVGDTLLVFTEATPAASGGVPRGDPELIGSGPAMTRVQHAIAQVAAHAHSVLILGATGTGKDLVARSLHRQSGRTGAFVAINCGSIPESVLDSELFGHARGAFTGAVSSREGLFRAAEHGTLFLDELGEMPPALQVKLLRALETRRIRPLGTSQEIPIDVRVVAATHRDVVAEVRDGRFRADLYARLAQWFIQMPSVRERREDIAPLSRHLLAGLDAAGRRFDVELAETLLLHDWPLNVRGLFNVLSMAVISAQGGTLTRDAQVAQALKAERRIAAVQPSEEPVPSPQPVRPLSPQPASEATPTARELEEFLDSQGGNIAEVARLIGCSRQQVYRWIEKFELDLDDFRAGSTPSS